MRKIIKLTHVSGETIYVNPTHITTMSAPSGDPQSRAILMLAGVERVDVKETVDQVLKAIDELG
jgi:uncharacterized protein YlzI (FlbEa/FlbD family)